MVSVSLDGSSKATLSTFMKINCWNCWHVFYGHAFKNPNWTGLVSRQKTPARPSVYASLVKT